MHRLYELIKLFLTEHGRIRRYRRVLSCFLACVVFVTTYALILPALTLDAEEAAGQPGIAIEQSQAEGEQADPKPIDVQETVEQDEQDLPEEAGAQELPDPETEPGTALEESEVPTDSVDQDGADIVAPSELEIIEEEETEEDKLITEPTTFTFEGEDYLVTASFDASAKFPKGVEMQVTEIRSEVPEEEHKEDAKAAREEEEAYQAYYDQALETVKETQSEQKVLRQARFFDISFVKEGVPYEPQAPIDVKFTYDHLKKNDEKLPEKEDTVTVLHFDDQEEAFSEVESDSEVSRKKDAVDITFASDSFSVYGIVYTVDFTWDVNGKAYEYKMIGGSAISLRSLIEALGVFENTSPVQPFGSNDKELTAEDFFNDIESVVFSNEELVRVIEITEDTTAGAIKENLQLEPEYSDALSEEQIAELDAMEFTAPDWALFSMKSFVSEETLTLTMEDGEAWVIKVRDPVTETAPGNMEVLTTADTRSQGIKMWLFDYDLDHSLDNDQNTAKSSNNKTDGINNYSAYKFLGWGASNKNGDGTNATGINDFTGLDNNNGNNIRAIQGIVQNTLEGGYPVLNDGTSLDYLFDPNANTADRVVYGGNKNEGNINRLFEYSGGYYTYDSDEHYAELKSDNTNFTVYTSTLAQTDKYGNLHNPARAVGFFPFDTYSHVYHDLKYETDDNHYGNSGTLYLNPDSTVIGNWYGQDITQNGPSGLNHHLGVAMEMDFIIPKGGVDDNGNPIEFKFSGDDDMWVFIDDQLVLDIGGLHQPVDGVIDFSTGKATITGKATQAGHSDNTGSNAIVNAEGAIDPRGNDFQFYQALNMPNGGDGKIHTMKIFYVERGGCDSNCMISFNLPLVKGKADVTVAKYDQSSNPVKPLKGVKFGLYSDAACTDLIEEIPSDENGVLLFEDLPIKNDSQKYYLKETAALPGYKPSETVYTLEVAEDGSGNYYFKVLDQGKEIETIGQEPAIPVIYNEPVEPIDLTVEKKWQDQSGNDVQPDDGMSATFQVKRYFRYEGEEEIPDPSQPVTFRVYRYKENNTPVQVGSDYTFKGNTKVYVNWGYQDGYYNNNYSGIMHYKEKINESYRNKTNPVTISLPESGEAAIYIRDENLNTQWGDGVINITVDGTPYAPSTIIRPISTEWAEDTEYNGPTLTLPDDKIDDNHPWTGKFEDLPLFEQRGDLTYMYKYYIVETAKKPANATPAYVDGNGHEISDPSTLQTDQNGNQTIINKLPEGSLNITKNIKTNGQVDPSKTGTFYYAVYKEPYNKDAVPVQIPVRTGSIEVTENGTKTVTENGLLHGTYYVYELTGQNGTPIVSEDNGTYHAINSTVYKVTGSGTSSTVSETAGTVTINNDHETVSKTATKTWSDNTDHPTIYFKLFYEKTVDGSIEEFAVDGAELKPLPSGTTSVTWDDLPKYDENGQEVVYTVKEYIEKDGGELTVGDKHYTNAAPDGYLKTEDGLTVSNDTSEEYNPKTTYTGKKHWVDTQNNGATRPESLQVTLYADGQPVTDKTPVWSNTNTPDWTYTFSDLPVFAADGHAIEYSVVETLKPGYTADEQPVVVPMVYRMKDTQSPPLKYEPNTLLDIPLTNDTDLGYIGVKKGTVHMVWTQRPISDPAIKEKIIYDLNHTEGLGFNNEVTMGNTTFVSGIPGEFVWEKGTLTVTWSAADKKIHLKFGKKSQWSLIAYGKYEFEYAPGSTEFTNRLNTTTVEADKSWVDSAGQPMTPIEGTAVTFDLFANNVQQNKPVTLNGKTDVTALDDDPEIAKTQEVNAEAITAGAYEKSAWKAFWDNLPTHDINGESITYTIQEISTSAGFANQNPEGVSAGGTITNKQTVIDIHIIKVNSENPAKPLTGAKFRLDQYDSQRKTVIKSWAETEVSNEAGKEGTLSFSGLGVGKYTLVETVTPDGYLKTDSDPEFEVVEIDGALTVQFTNVPGVVTYEPTNKTFTVHNEPGAALPNAGGPGTTLFTILGFLMATLAGSGFLLLKKKGGF